MVISIKIWIWLVSGLLSLSRCLNGAVKSSEKLKPTARWDLAAINIKLPKLYLEGVESVCYDQYYESNIHA